MANPTTLLQELTSRFVKSIQASQLALDEITLEINKDDLREVCFALRDESTFAFEQLIDICGVDYYSYGLAEWETDKATNTGFDRGVDCVPMHRVIEWDKPRFAVVYHLLSVKHNHRVRLKVFLEAENLLVESVLEIWPAADWFEREAFDLYGIMFNGHPDLRRILTDYGFIGYPFRKDFPLIGNVEPRYDAAERRVVYEPVSIPPRILVPKIIREDNRYMHPVTQKEPTHG